MNKLAKLVLAAKIYAGFRPEIDPNDSEERYYMAQQCKIYDAFLEGAKKALEITNEVLDNDEMGENIYIINIISGTSIDEAFKEAIYFSKLKNQKVKFRFNGVNCYVNPYSNIELGIVRYDDAIINNKLTVDC